GARVEHHLVRTRGPRALGQRQRVEARVGGVDAEAEARVGAGDDRAVLVEDLRGVAGAGQVDEVAAGLGDAGDGLDPVEQGGRDGRRAGGGVLHDRGAADHEVRVGVRAAEDVGEGTI